MNLMDKRKVENARVIREIEDAFFALLNEKNFSEITVTDLIRKSGVARVSYYRNFDSKEDIIRKYFKQLREEIESALEYSAEKFGDNLNRHLLAKHLSFYLKEKHNMLILYDNGFGTMMLEEANYYIEDALGDMPNDSIERYRLYFATGAMFNAMIQWLKSGARETPGEMAQIIMGLLESCLPSEG